MRFLQVQLAVFVTVIVTILLASGTLVAEKEAWKGLGLLAAIAAVLAAAVWVLVKIFTSPAMSSQQAVPVATLTVVLGFGALVLMMGVGHEWLRSLLEPFKTAGLWWPIATFIGASMAYWLAQPEAVGVPEAEQAGVDAYL